MKDLLATIELYDDDDTRVGLKRGSQGFQPGNTGFRKPGEIRNVKGKNQYDPLRTLKEVQKAIDDAPPITIKGKTFERNAKDLMADSSYVNKKKGGTQYITRREFDEYKDKLKFKATGPKNFGEETRKKAADKRRDFTKTRSSESLEKALAAPQKSKLNFHHAGFKESLTDLKNTMYIPGSPNRKMAKLFEDPLLKEMEAFTKVFDDPKATTKQKQKAAADYLKNDRALRQKYPEFKNFKTRLSFRRTSLDPSGIMFKEKLRDPSLAISQEPGMTLKGETPSTPKGKEILKKGKQSLEKVKGLIPFMKDLGIKCQLSKGINCMNPQAYEKSLNQLSKAAQAGDEAAAAKMANFTKAVRGAGGVIKGVLGPAAIAFEVGTAVPFGLFEYAQGKPTDEIINTLTYGLAGTARENKLKKLSSDYGVADKADEKFAGYLSTLNRLGEYRDPYNLRPGKRVTEKEVLKTLQPFYRVSPQSEQGEFFDEDSLNRSRARSRAAEQKLYDEDMERKKQRTQMFDLSNPFMAAGGGIAKEAGDPSGRPPESGPQPQGLLSLKNRVRNY